MGEDRDSDYVGLPPVLSPDKEDKSFNIFVDLLPRRSGVLSPFYSSDVQRENETNHYSARSDYSDEGHWPEGVWSSPKRRKIPGVDRISELPDSVIHHILSFLPAEDAVKTGVLSKRWMYLWTCAPKLTFRYNPCRPELSVRRFLRFVDKTLFFYSSNKMEKFELDLDCVFAEKERNHLDSLIQKWLRFVTRCLVEELSLKFCGSVYHYPIPQFVFNSSSLTKLSTTECYYAPNGQVCWTSLRVLTIEHAELFNDALQKILAGSPMLKYLKLYACSVITSINISSSSVLEYLEVHRCGHITRIDASSNSRLEKLVLKEMRNDEYEEHNDVIEILCPNLKSVEISGYWFQKICRLLNVSSLIDACLTFELEVSQFDYIDIPKELLEKIKHVKKITLGSYCVQVLSLLEFRGLPSPLSGSSCECLTLNTELNKWYPFGLAHLLYCFPTLQKLVIDMTIISVVEESPDVVFPENYLERVDRTLICLLEHLKTIEITSFIPYQLEPDDLGFVSFLLGNARVLKEMVIHFGCKGSEFDLGEEAKLFDLTQKLLSLPRCSPHAVVLID
ncbi:hypothetical protein SLEP1_g48830 [Rubroshorea leprosula]|uniref:F-box domain-containing protein n=1 Tax=Rubroshorea leprosula TaxID=152421 RepID=A0AAV5LXY3_9ROSI|nr:hypothetical protein SLEP1_g48830 [Rubroshorea leprosula]